MRARKASLIPHKAESKVVKKEPAKKPEVKNKKKTLLEIIESADEE